MLAALPHPSSTALIVGTANVLKNPKEVPASNMNGNCGELKGEGEGEGDGRAGRLGVVA